MDKALLAIGGGVGPMAGTLLHQKIIENTQATGDSDHFKLVHISRPISDRTQFLLDETSGLINPAEGMFETLLAARSAVSTLDGNRMIFGVPCNTFHSPKIFSQFLKLVKALDGEPDISVINMIEEVGAYIKANYPEAKKIGLMSTTGTRNTRVYHNTLESNGLEVVEVPETTQAELHDSIYNPEWGIKAMGNISENDQARKNFLSYSDTLNKLGAHVIVLGCTEIPIALPESIFRGTPLIDPMHVLARAMIRSISIEKLKAVLTI